MAQKVNQAQLVDYVDVELSRPLEIDGTKVSKLRMREPTVGDQIAVQKMKGDDTDKELAMMANLCEITPEDVQKLTLRDFRRLQEAFLGFTE